MLKNILAVITASVSLAACNADSKEPAVRLSETFKRPLTNPGRGSSPSDDHAGSPTATTPGHVGPGNPVAAEAGTTANGQQPQPSDQRPPGL